MFDICQQLWPQLWGSSPSSKQQLCPSLDLQHCLGMRSHNMLCSVHNICGQKHMGKLLSWALMTAEALNQRGKEPQKGNKMLIVFFFFFPFFFLFAPLVSCWLLKIWFGQHKSVAPVDSCLAWPLLYIHKAMWEQNDRGASPNSCFNANLAPKWHGET